MTSVAAQIEDDAANPVRQVPVHVIIHDRKVELGGLGLWCPAEGQRFEIRNVGTDDEPKCGSDDPCQKLDPDLQETHWLCDRGTDAALYEEFVESGPPMFGGNTKFVKLFAEIHGDELREALGVAGPHFNTSAYKFCELLHLKRLGTRHGGWNAVRDKLCLSETTDWRWRNVGELVFGLKAISFNIERFQFFHVEEIASLKSNPKVRDALLADPELNFEGQKQRPSAMKSETIQRLTSKLKKGKVTLDELISGGAEQATPDSGDAADDVEKKRLALTDEERKVRRHAGPKLVNQLDRVFKMYEKACEASINHPEWELDIDDYHHFFAALRTMTAMAMTLWQETSVAKAKARHGIV